ncbi:hypothetical protein BDF19DRAFT_410176 [Syncephalis fuscata]|nr:hypothetical protein BDF19DRAFT_410176 [Syncephalis fuscata]
MKLFTIVTYIMAVALIASATMVEAKPKKYRRAVQLLKRQTAFQTSFGKCVKLLKSGSSYKVQGCSAYSASQGCTSTPGDPSASYPGCCPKYKCPFAMGSN